jgi:hypothetical protein
MTTRLLSWISLNLKRQKKRYLPVLWLGFTLWTIGAGLKSLFSRTSPIALYVVAVTIEGFGVGFVFSAR